MMSESRKVFRSQLGWRIVDTKTGKVARLLAATSRQDVMDWAATASDDEFAAQAK